MDYKTLFGIAASAGKLRFQFFPSNGTFTPSPGLLAAGGVVYREVYGGGGGGAGGSSTSGSPGSPGGGGEFIDGFEVVTAPVSVIRGLGGALGAVNADGTDGGASSFGTTVARGGLKGRTAFATAGDCPGGGKGAPYIAVPTTSGFSPGGGQGGLGRNGKCAGGSGSYGYGGGAVYYATGGAGGAGGPGQLPTLFGAGAITPGYAAEPNTGNGGNGGAAGQPGTQGQSGGVLVVWVEED